MRQKKYSQVFYFRLSEQMESEVIKLSKKLGISKTQVIRKALAEKINKDASTKGGNEDDLPF